MSVSPRPAWWDRALRTLALAAIRAYQRWLSPHKGFACAWRVHTGGPSCSALGARAIRRHGLFTGLGLLDQRLGRCGEAHRRAASARRQRLRPQAGVCDAGCDAPGCDLPCDGGHGHGSGCSPCDLASGCDGGCGRRERRRRSDDARQTYIPPRRQR